ncbi:hypothetical protein ALC57_16822 [Trachymyrmex cornetzi]|uniref:DDE Tnp4 domain-containing protein n=1 Tax=Trachymyrmex cornetzi TaxID=471704 RepID=A0A151IUE7_9HYME|nr:hypothetical protein ALC57_16822 [Trachymyrmex cornetzi]
MKIHEWLVQCTHVINQQNAEADRRDKLLGSLALLLVEKKKRRNKKKRLWVAPIFQKRCEHSLYHALLPTLKLEDLRFHNYFRMLATQYEELLCPDNAGYNFYNYKNSHSIVLLAICDANYIFRFIDIGAYGRRSDGGIFRESQLDQHLEAGQINIPQPDSFYRGGPLLPYCIVGDEAFPLKSYLLRPFSGKDNLSAERCIYNYRLSRARRVIENCFGILVSQWRIYRKSIISSVETTMKIVQATICLHNWLRKSDIEQTNNILPGMLNREMTEDDYIRGSWRTVMEDGCAFMNISRCSTNTSARDAMLIRDEFCKYFNDEGSVAWQNDR